MNEKKKNPTPKAGTNATKRFFNNFMSTRNFLQYKTTTASIAPSWIIISKFFTNPVWVILKMLLIRTWCAVEEIGRNSVTPSTKEIISACTMFTKLV